MKRVGMCFCVCMPVCLWLHDYICYLFVAIIKDLKIKLSGAKSLI